MKFDRLLEEVRSKIDIVDFISDYVQLKKSGQNYKALCPFHAEKTPSFMVSQPKQIFHCFGCGAGGDVVSFLMKHETLSFNEAMQVIAKKAGIKIGEFAFDKDRSERREKLLTINREAANFFIKNLHDSEAAGMYLKKRGIEDVSLQSFSIGYAPSKRDGLMKFLKKMEFSDSLIKDAGLIVSDEKGSRDVFRGRIIFPIYNYQNDIVAFGGRVLDDALPKYLNSPETELFKKGETLFALNLAKEEIRKKGYAVLVEGYLDTIICHQYGFKNTVAPLGTALTLKQLRRLKPLAKKIVLVFDGDAAGVAAAKRSLEILSQCNFRTKILLLPEGEDPDSFLRKKGSQPFKRMLAGALSMTEFLLNTLKMDKIDAAKEILRIISHIGDMIVADQLLRELAEKTRIDESVLRSELKQIKKNVRSNVLEGLGLMKAAQYREEYLLLSAIIAFPEKAEYVLSQIDAGDLKDETVQSLFKKINSLGKTFSLESLLNEAGEEKALITGLSLKPGFDLEHVDRNIEDCLQTMTQKRFEEKRKQAEKCGDISLLNALLKEKRELLKGHMHGRIL
ncbi:MAG TPA: DNA primase [Thermodesulfovibrionales bacterium]|nr:DNA primase [Thermodesulfovibrionales bacterium]